MRCGCLLLLSVRAGVALSIGHDLASLSDWAGLWDEHRKHKHKHYQHKHQH